MTKHLADQHRTRGSARLREYLRQERSEMPHRATLTLQARPKDRDQQDHKAAQYLRIARGAEA
ncbi:MAG: hypothetical protein ACU0DH_07300 [Paracoccus sp. (in: a-proteobacteria)]|uniref:hypothetical protein n=1 Tax=Paracoccus sp. TaxID=267 RepID=UPI002E8735BF|nr:hypothetical protein [Pseudomonadota bacterium]